MPRGVDLSNGRQYLGDNNQSTLALYYYRLLYKATFKSDGYGIRNVRKSITDFEYGEKILYGRVNEHMMPILARESRLADLPTLDQTKVYRVFDFIAAAFTDFQNAFLRATEKGQIDPNEGFMTFPEPKKAYIAPTNHYMEYRAAMYEIFNKKMKQNKSANAKIKSFRTFVPYLDEFIHDAATQAPFTLSAYMRSQYAEPHMTGLVIDLLEQDTSRDKRKVKMVYDNQNYPFYENMAMQFGFSIDKNVPWRLVADIRSPAMDRYLKRFGYKSWIDVIKKCYENTYLVGYNNFKSLYVIYYNSFARFNPSVARPSMKCDGTYIGKRTYRRTEDLVQLNIDLGEQWFLEKYAMIRNAEEGSPLSEDRVKQIVNRAFKISKYKGKAKCLEMINKNLIETDRRSGSINEKVEAYQKAIREQEEKETSEQRRPGTLSY